MAVTHQKATEIFESHPMRFNKKEKAALRATLRAEMNRIGYADSEMQEVNESGTNFVVGDPHAEYMLTAHYDTPRRALLPNLMNIFRTSGQMKIGWSGRQTESRQEYLCRKKCSFRRLRIFVRNCLKSTTPMFWATRSKTNLLSSFKYRSSRQVYGCRNWGFYNLLFLLSPSLYFFAL